MTLLLHGGATNQAYMKGQKVAEQAINGAALCGETARRNAEGPRGVQDHQQEGGCKIISIKGRQDQQERESQITASLRIPKR
jgi:hypothetical protein